MSLDYLILSCFNASITEVQAWVDREKLSYEGLQIFCCISADDRFLGKLIEKRFGFLPNIEIQMQVNKFKVTQGYLTGSVALFRLFDQLGSAFSGEALLLFQGETPFLYLRDHTITVNSQECSPESLPAQQIKMEKIFQPMAILE